jgi:hypothetical protein
MLVGKWMVLMTTVSMEKEMTTPHGYMRFHMTNLKHVPFVGELGTTAQNVAETVNGFALTQMQPIASPTVMI